MHSTLVRGLLVTALLAVSGALAFGADPKTKTKVLLDFTRQDVEIDGGIPKPIKKYDYSFEAWSGKLVYLEGKGLLVPALPGRGGFGKDDRLGFNAAVASCLLEYVIGSRNEAASFTVSMVDSDGTEVSWHVGLTDKPRGVPLGISLDLAKPDTEDKPGKKSGFDKTKVKTWQIKGNWQEPKIEVLFIRASAVGS